MCATIISGCGDPVKQAGPKKLFRMDGRKWQSRFDKSSRLTALHQEVTYSSRWGYSLINTLKLKEKVNIPIQCLSTSRMQGLRLHVHGVVSGHWIVCCVWWCLFHRRLCSVRCTLLYVAPMILQYHCILPCVDHTVFNTQVHAKTPFSTTSLAAQQQR